MTRTLIGTKLLIHQNRDNGFNLDTILLSNFAKFRYNSKQIIDFGCGNGAISLFISSKTSAKIIGVDIQEQLVLEARKNVSLNGLEERITIIQEDIKNTPKLFKDIDCIICNPPFFKTNDDSKTNIKDNRTVARHEITICLEDIIISAGKILKTRGQLFIIHRPERFNEILTLCSKNRLVIKRIRLVHPYINKKANHILLEIHKDGKEEIVFEPPLILYESKNVITEELRKIYEGERNVT